MNPINFKQERDLGITLQDASTFIKQNFGKMLKPTLIVVIVPLILSSVLMVMAMQSLYGTMATLPNDPTAMLSAMSGMIPAYLLLMVTYVMTYVMFIGYIKLYVAGKENITLGDLTAIL